MSNEARSSFGLDDFGLDDRLRLFTYVTTENRTVYLWLLRAFDAARDNYHVLLHTTEVAAALARLAGAHPDCPSPTIWNCPDCSMPADGGLVGGSRCSERRRRRRGMRHSRPRCGAPAAR